MAKLTQAEFETKWHANFPNNTTGQITETRLRNFVTDIKDSFVTEAAPAAPVGVFFTTAPGAPTISTNSITETASVVSVNGTSKAVASQTISVPLAAAGKKRIDAIVVNYNATPAVYARIAGPEVSAASTAPSPSIPADRLWVRFLNVTDGQVGQEPAGAIKVIEMADGTEVLPDVNGRAMLPSFGAGGSVDTVNGQAPDGSKNVTIEAQHIDYTPADAGFFAGLLTNGKLKIKAALDAVAAKAGIPLLQIKTITANYTVTPADHGYVILIDSASPVLITVPTGLQGREMVFKQKGSGSFTFVAGSGAQVDQYEGKYTSAGQRAVVTLFGEDNITCTVNGQLKL